MYTFDGKPSTAKLLRCISEIGSILFSTLETSISNTTDRHKFSSGYDSLTQEYNKMPSEKLKSTITSLILSETASTEDKRTKNFAWSRYQVSILVLFLVMVLGYFVSFFRTLIFWPLFAVPFHGLCQYCVVSKKGTPRIPSN